MKKKIILWVLSLVFLLALGQQLYKLYFLWQGDNFTDFKVYWDALKAAFAGGDIYSFNKVYFNTIPFNYPPTSLLFLTFLLIFPKALSSLFLVFVSLGCLLGTIYLTVKMLFKKADRLMAFLIFSILFIQFFPVKFTLTLGQINLLILFLITVSYYFFQNKKEILSGIFLGIATLIKIFPGFLIFFFIKEKKWKSVISFIVTLFSGLILTLLIFKLALIFNYFSNGGNLFLQGGVVSYFDQSLNSFLLRFNFPSIWRLLLRIIFTLFSLGFFLKVKDKALSFFALIFSILIFFPSFAWFHHYVILIPLMMILWARSKDIFSKVVLILIYLLVAFHFRYPEIFPNENPWLGSHPFFGTLLLWVFAVKRGLNKKIDY